MRLSSVRQLGFVAFVGLAATGCAANAAPHEDVSEELVGAGDLFASRTPITFTLEGALAEAFDAASAGVPNGPLPGMPSRTFDERPGTITVTAKDGSARAVAITFKVRGNSSLVECAFPKLTVKLTDAGRLSAKGTPLEGHKKLKLGTHCGEDAAGDRGTVGRLRNEIATYREALLLRALEVVFPVALQSRAAVVRYADANGSKLERKAFVFESVEALAKRSGAVDACRIVDGDEECSPVLTDGELATFDPRGVVDPKTAAALVYFHAAVGNWDWHLDFGADVERGSSRVWNHDVITFPGESSSPGAPKTFVPVAHDFDLASAVTARGRGRDPVLTEAALAKQLDEQLARIDGLSKTDLDAARALLVAKRSDLEALATSEPIDDEGRENFRAHLRAFYAKIAPSR